MVKNIETKQLKLQPVAKVLETLPPPPLMKVASNTRPCSKLGGTTLNWGGGGREVSVISHRPVTSSDLKHERLFFLGRFSTVLQLVIAKWLSYEWNITYSLVVAQPIRMQH